VIVICNRVEDGWELIYQQAHALLAASLVAPWREVERCRWWQETLIAVSQHDNGWQEWESGTRLTASGEPLDFMDTPVEDVVAQAARAVTRAWHQSLWVGLLVSQHICHLHESRRGEYEPLDALLDVQGKLQAQWREALGITRAAAESAYGFLRWGDTLSLLLCRGALAGNGPAPIGKGPAGVEYTVRLLDRGRCTVEPWPFCCDEFAVHVDAYRVAQARFSDTDAFANAVYENPPRPLTWRLVRSTMVVEQPHD
jgi:hypothetical protein